MGKKRPSATPATPTPAKKLKLSPKKRDRPETQSEASGGLYRGGGGGERGDEEDFPRGGQAVLSALEKRVIREQAKRDTLFQEGGDGDDVMTEVDLTRKVSVKQLNKGKAAATKVGSASSRRRVDTLSPKSLTPGMLLLGAVQEIGDLELTVSLPHNMCGVVTISSVSDPMTEEVEVEVEEEGMGEESVASGLSTLSRLFHTGQLLVCCVLSEVEKGKGRVKLSVNPRVVNSHLSARDIADGMVYPGWVRSVEDHGYIIDFGVAGKTGFLLKKNATEFVRTCNKGKPLVRGQVMRCKVLSAVDARSVPVSVEPSLVGGALVGGNCLVQLHALQPGTLINAAVKEPLSNGLMVSFLGGFEGSVSARHLPSWDTSLNSLPSKKKVRGRLLWVDVEGKKLGVGLQRTVVEGRSFVFPGMEFGDRFEDAEIVQVYPDSSLLLRLGPGQVGYCPLPLVYDERQEKLSREHRVGSRHPCRVVQFNLIDGTVIVSLQPSVLSQRYMRYADISVSDILDATVERHGSFGMILMIQGNIRGLCPTTHLSDARLKNPRKKFEEGKPVKCRVLHVDAGERRVLLTCRKSLLRLTGEEVLAEYAQATPGRVFKGVVSRVHGRGCTVFFFNNVLGYVPQSEMVGAGQAAFPDPASVVQPGQVLECRVLECAPETRRLRLSLHLDAAAPLALPQELRLKPGMVITAEVTGVTANGLMLRCPETGESAFLPTGHLSDYPDFCARVLSQHQHSLAAAVEEGRVCKLAGVLVVCGKLSSRPALLSLKPSLLQSATAGQSWASDYSQLKPDQVLTGFIRKVMSYGCFVEFPHNLSALAPSKYLQDEFTSDPSQVYQEGQTVFAKVLEVKEDKRRFLVSLRQSDVRLCARPPHGSGEEEGKDEGGGKKELGERLESYLAERERVMEGSVAQAELFPPGRVVTGMVCSLEEREVVVTLGGGVTGKASTHTAQGVEVEVGGEVECCVLEGGVEIVWVSLNQALVEGASAGQGEKAEGKKRKRKSGAKQAVLLPMMGSVVGVVERITPHYLMVAIATLAGSRLAYAVMDSGQLGVLSAPYKHLKLGQKVATVVHSPASVSGGKQQGPPIVVVTSTRVSETKAVWEASSKPSFLDVKPGDVISVIVKTVKTSYLSVRYHLWQGRVHCCLATDEPCPGQTPFAKVSPGDVVKARVVCVREKEIRGLGSKKGATISTLELSTRESLLVEGAAVSNEQLLRSKFSKGEEVFGFVKEVNQSGISVHLSPKTLGFARLMMTHTDPEVLWNLRRHFAEGEAVKCTVVGGGKKSSQLTVSLTGAVVAASVGTILECLVHEVTPLYLILSVPWGVGFGRVDITDTADEYTESPLEKFKGHRDIVKCCVVSVSGEKLDLSLRPSRTCGGSGVGGSPDLEIASLEDVPEGTIVRGYVKAVTNVGVFVRMGRGVDGRVQIRNLADGYVKNYKKKFPVGLLVKAKVIGVNPAQRQVELSLRLSHTDPAAAKRERRRADRERGTEAGKKMEGSSDGESAETDSSEESSDEEEEDMEEVEEEEEDKKGKPTLQLSGYRGFVWEKEGGERGDQRDDSGSDGEREETVEEVSSKKSRRQKKAAKKAEEEQLYLTERALLEPSRAPENEEDFERLLVSHPNSSALWVQYMAFLLQTAEVDRARAAGERALAAISFREEGEKLNVWVALMNLENLYGSQESLVSVFQSALQQNEPLEVFKRLAAIYQESKKMDLAEQLFQTMTKRFGSELSVWTEFGHFLMRRGKLDAARRLLQRCLKALALKQQHVEAISKFAQCEFKYGEKERGGTMFESLVTSYPRRTDLWSVYVDMLVKARQPDKAREVLERAVHLKLSAKKMKLMFKRYLEFERQHGTPAGIEAVKDKARTYVEAKMAQQEM